MIKTDEFMFWYNKWVQDNAEEKRYDYPLNENSIVMDVGFYKGEFTRRIYEKYKCKIYGFEPVTSIFMEGYKNIISLNADNKLQVFNFGLARDTKRDNIYLNNDESSLFKHFPIGTEKRVEAYFVSIEKTLMNMLNLVTVDLLKLNVEGQEYEILESLLDTGYINLFNHIQIQFHNFMSDATKKRQEIRERLAETHIEKWCYNWIWESHSRKY